MSFFHKSYALKKWIISLSKRNREEVALYYEQYNSVEQLATAMHMSTSTFKRRFQENFECTPHAWISDRKLEKAAVLLQASQHTITDISFICGF